MKSTPLILTGLFLVLQAAHAQSPNTDTVLRELKQKIRDLEVTLTTVKNSTITVERGTISSSPPPSSGHPMTTADFRPIPGMNTCVVFSKDFKEAPEVLLIPTYIYTQTATRGPHIDSLDYALGTTNVTQDGFCTNIRGLSGGGVNAFAVTWIAIGR